MSAIRGEQGFSVMEVLISAALATVVLAGVWDLYVASSKNVLGQGNNLQMQIDTKAALDYMVKDLRMAITAKTPLTVSTMVIANDTLTFARGEDSGYASGGSSTTLTDTTKAWATSPMKFLATYGPFYVWVKNPPGPGESHAIASNTGTVLTLAAGQTWATTPTLNPPTLYFIYRDKIFTRFPDNTIRYSKNSGGTYSVLAKNMSDLSFSLVTDCSNNALSTGVKVSVTGRSAVPDPNTHTYRTYTLCDTVTPRN